MGHIHDQIDFTASAYIVYEGKILLIHHKKLDIWMQIGGHVELDEDPDTTLLREVKEESGLDVEVLSENPGIAGDEPYPHRTLNRPDGVDWFKFGAQDHYHVDMAYYCRALNDEVKLEADAAHDIRWFSPQELDDPAYDIEPIVKHRALEAIKRAAQ